MEPIETYDVDGKTVSIYRDEDSSSPREWDNLSTFAGYHRNYHIGDPKNGDVAFRHVPTLREVVEREGRGEILAAVELHLRELGRVGWAYVTRANAVRMGCHPGQTYVDQQGVTRTYNRAFFEEATRQEIATYQQWADGDVYGYTVDGRDGDGLDSCWGFFGHDYVREEARSAAKACEDPASDREAAELAARATYAGVSP